MPTNITNTSITTDNLTVDTDTIHVDSANNRVGIGTTSPTVPLQVAGDIKESVSGANAQISAITDGASNYATFTATNGSRSYSMQIRPDQNNAFTIRDETGAGNRVLVDTNGYVTMPNQPAFMAFKVGNQSVGTTVVQVTGWNNNLDIGSNWDNSQNRYTVPTAGIYLAGGFYQANQSTGLHFGIYKNGSAYGNDSLLDMVAGAANGYSVPFSMAANDYFTWVSYCSATSNINANRSKIWVIKVA
jgi:hypothetical protein